MQKVDTRIEASLIKAIKELAKKENRSFCGMLRVLIIEGYKERTLEPTIKE